jgi:hypothetical protein
MRAVNAAANVSFTFIVWNGLPYACDLTIELPVAHPSHWVVSGIGVSCPTFASQSGVTNYALENDESLPYTFGIIAREVPPLGMTPIRFEYQGQRNQQTAEKTTNKESGATPGAVANTQANNKHIPAALVVA